MRVRKVLGLLLAVAMVGSMFAGCGKKEETAPTTETEAATEEGADAVEEAAEAAGSTEGLKIGLSVYDLANPYFVSVANGAKAKCEELGIELIVDDPKSDAAAQVTALDNFITMEVDAIIVSPLDVAACESVVKEAKEKGIVVISQSSCTETHDVWVSADEYNMGYVCGGGAADWIVEKYGADADFTVAVFCWDQISTQIARGDGMEDAILEKCPNINIVRQDANTTAAGQSVADSLLQAHPDLQAIVCINDAAGIGAYSAVQAAGKDTTDFYIGSIDATDEAKAQIQKGGAYQATVDLIPYENGGIDVELAVQLINGETLDDTYVIPAQLVTAKDL